MTGVGEDSEASPPKTPAPSSSLSPSANVQQLKSGLGPRGKAQMEARRKVGNPSDPCPPRNFKSNNGGQGALRLKVHKHRWVSKEQWLVKEDKGTVGWFYPKGN